MPTRYRGAVAGAVLLAAIAAMGDPAGASWNVGGATVTGAMTPAAATAGCAAPFTFQGDATGVVFNTVITGDIGAITIAGTGCADDSSLRLYANGRGPTGSTLRCATLTGSYKATGPAFELSVAGACVVNSFDTGTITYVATVATTPTGAFRGVVQVEVDEDRTLVYT